MARCHMDYLEKSVQICFERLGFFVGSHPWWFLLIPLVLSASLGSGFYFLNENISNNIEEQFTPADGPAKTERKYIQETFPSHNAMFSTIRQSKDGNFGVVVATSDTDILTVASFDVLLDLDVKIRNMEVIFGNQSFKYADICAKVKESCSSNHILEVIDHNSSHVETIRWTFPWFQTDSEAVPVFLSLGGVTVKSQSFNVENAKAVQLHYDLVENEILTNLWLESFISLVSNESSHLLQISYSTSMSMQWELEKSSVSVVHLFSITYTITIVFSIMTCWRMDNVRSKVWVAYCGILSTGLSILSGFGVLLLLGESFVMTAASCPFMILGIGLDDMFIMISCWQKTRVLDDVPKRLAATYRSAAVSITITTVTDAAAFFLGCNSSFGSVRSFCLYAGISVSFCYLYSITFLGACMALDGLRETENKHWFTCVKIPEESPSRTSKAFVMCCAGGRYDQMTEMEETGFGSHMFERFYGPFLTHKWTKSCVYVVYAGYLAVSIYGAFSLKDGLDLKNLALDDSYIVKYYDDQRQFFSEYSCNVMVAVKQPFPYWDMSQQRLLQSCISSFEGSKFVNSTSAWFTSFYHHANVSHLNVSSREAFYDRLSLFLEANPMLKQDLNRTADGEIQASRFFIQTLDKKRAGDMMIELREIAEECPVELLVYHPSFIYFDQYAVVTSSTIQSVLIAVIVVLFVSLILLPNPLCSVWVGLAICSIIFGVTGFMSLWGVNLDCVSMINLVMCIGFSVDFSAHVCYSFVSSMKNNVNEKAIDALARVGYPILQGGLSSVLGVVLLSMSGSYIFRTFFKIVFLVVVFGLLHALVFIPVFFTLLGVCKKNW